MRQLHFCVESGENFALYRQFADIFGFGDRAAILNDYSCGLCVCHDGIQGQKIFVGSKVFGHDAPRRSDPYTRLYFL